MMEAQRAAGVDGGGGGGCGEGQSSFSKRWTRIKCPIKWRGKKKEPIGDKINLEDIWVHTSDTCEINAQIPRARLSPLLFPPE